MNILRTGALSATQKESLLRLWNQEYPVQLSFPSVPELEHYLRTLAQPQHYIVEHPAASSVAWACAFNREGERWFAIIVDGSLQKTGIGTALLHALKQDAIALNGWVTDHSNYKKPNGETYPSPLRFYLKNEFTICPEQRLETEQLSAVRIKWSGISCPDGRKEQ